MNILRRTIDWCNQSVSVMCELSIKEFLQLILDRDLLDKTQRLEEQRDFLETKKAKTITDRLKKDILSGGLLPPISIGVIDTHIDYKNSEIMNKDGDLLEAYLKDKYLDKKEVFLTIVDGIQRTNILKGLADAEPEKFNTVNSPIIVDFIVTKEKFNLLNRMFVLNFGQTPWGVEQQARVVWKILGLRSNIDELSSKHLLTFFYAYVYKKHDKVIQDDMDYVYTNLTLLDSPITHNNSIDGELFDRIFTASKIWGVKFGKNTVLFKTAFYAAFAVVTDGLNDKIEKLISLIDNIDDCIHIDMNISKMNAYVSSFTTGVGAKQRKFYHDTLCEIFRDILSSQKPLEQERLEQIWDGVKEDITPNEN